MTTATPGTSRTTRLLALMTKGNVPDGGSVMSSGTAANAAQSTAATNDKGL